nr:hypothetical protein [uncultured Sphaerochaeta sp.]
MDKATNGVTIECEGMSAEEVAQKVKEALEKDHKINCLHSYTEKTMNLRWGKQLVVDKVVEGMSISKMVSVLEQMEVCQACGKAIWVPVPKEECL